jgi:hypothetical protein
MDNAGEDAAWPWADTWPIARLVVLGLGVDQIVLEGADGRWHSGRDGSNHTLLQEKLGR